MKSHWAVATWLLICASLAGCSSGSGSRGTLAASAAQTGATSTGPAGATGSSTPASAPAPAASPATPPTASGQTYYVASSGSDANTGTSAAPFATLQRAADQAVAGDVVFVADGTYAGFAGVNSGAQGAPITFWANGSNVVIDRAGAQSSGGGIDLRQPSSPLSDIVIEGFKLVGVPAFGVRLSWTTRVVIRGCTLQRCGLSGGHPNVYGGHTTDALIEGNEISGAGEHGIYIANSSTGATIRGNDIHHNKTAGVHHNGDRRYLPGDGIIHRSLIEGNLIHDNGQNGLNWDGVQDSVVRNNFIYGNASNGLRAFGPPNPWADSAEGPKNNLIVNNTIVVPASGGWCLRLTDDLGGNVIFNNVLICENPSRGAISLDNPVGFSIGRNAISGRLSLDRGNTRLTLSAWQAAGYGQGSFVAVASDLFVAPAQDDYHLSSASSAVDRGVVSFAGASAPAVDFDGGSRPLGAAPDVGAHEAR